ncbi:GntR family transcriptional regulator [Paracoccus sp. Z330]|uniref:GntR family transcriptional regulator n=1 Tax=Paracoccus onchidii TaxID=3017813 RepID=A0ABT4ZFT8_9RHOB|nr:GntR family transcriptional regulator [Paracoccus onchidii]MDB6178203.1 GntR family transcriptional regulator [Paracoccus onchidii]
MTEKLKISRTDDAYERLRAEIRTNSLSPGYQAPEAEYAMRLGMSRTPVREALIRLEAEGLVELKPRRGARVLPIKAEDMQEIYELLKAIEPEAAAELAQRGLEDADRRALQKALDGMRVALAAKDLDAWAKADDQYHVSLLEAAGNQRRKAFVMHLYDQAHRARIITLRLREMPEKSTEEHAQILDLLCRGEADKVRVVFREHRERAARELLGILDTFRLQQL